MFKKFFVVSLIVLCFVASSFVTAFAVNDNLTYDEVVSKWGINYDTSQFPYYVLIRETNSDNYILVISSEKNAVDVKNGFAFADFGLTYYCDFYNNSYISNNSSNTTDTSLGRLSELNFISSNYDVMYEGNNEIFFQQPTLLNQLLSQVPQGVGEKLITDLGTLTICGISLIALLVVLYLVPKVLHKFRV